MNKCHLTFAVNRISRNNTYNKRNEDTDHTSNIKTKMNANMSMSISMERWNWCAVMNNNENAISHPDSWKWFRHLENDEEKLLDQITKRVALFLTERRTRTWKMWKYVISFFFAADSRNTIYPNAQCFLVDKYISFFFLIYCHKRMNKSMNIFFYNVTHHELNYYHS